MCYNEQNEGDKMFEDLLKQLKEMDGKSFTYTFSVEPDEKGYYDKECPNDNCLKKFKVYADDWHTLNKGDMVYCPFCGKSKGTDSWWTTEQIENSKRQARSDLAYKIHSAIKKDSEIFNSKQKKGFITIKMQVRDVKKPVLVPLSALESLQQEIVCPHCNKRYAVIGASYYCPFCGKHSTPVILKNSLNTIKAKMENLENIYNGLKTNDVDTAEFIKQSLIETSFGELVATFQKLCEEVYSGLPNAILPPKKNVFQRIDEASTLWQNAIGKDYSSWLNINELENLKTYFQKRHILEHKQGIIDTDYINKTHDKNYQVGQRLVVKKEDVIEFANLIEKLANEILVYA